MPAAASEYLSAVSPVIRRFGISGRPAREIEELYMPKKNVLSNQMISRFVTI